MSASSIELYSCNLPILRAGRNCSQIGCSMATSLFTIILPSVHRLVSAAESEFDAHVALSAGVLQATGCHDDSLEPRNPFRD
jgi:hypothetical protein